MSISEQVKELREFEIGWLHDVPMAKSIMNQAADTIEAFSAKLQTANMERSAEDCGGWIPCKERLPEEKINPITKDFCEYQVTFKIEDATDIRHYKFGRGHWWNGPGIMVAVGGAGGIGRIKTIKGNCGKHRSWKNIIIDRRFANGEIKRGRYRTAF